MKETVAVVVTYNRKELLKECIKHLLSQTAPTDILVVDNASTDGTAELFSAPQDGIFYFNTGANLGGAGGFNFGMRKAAEMGYDFVWVMDDDTMPSPTAHEKLLEVDGLLEGNYGWLSSLTLWKDGTPCAMNIQKITKWKPLGDFEYSHSVQYASFVSLFIKADTIREFGLPYKEFFIWGDDWEYTRRISKHKPCFFVPGSVVKHECKTNNGSDITKENGNNLDRYAYSYRNDVVVYRQDGIDGALFLLLRIAKHSIKIIIKSGNKAQKLKLMFSSLKEGMKFRPEIEYLG
ncbi:MAG: glycosyltransferase family 2 protein [Clostridia bacterium]|nr:glycosyltransferase family 2 protein [Clostridia bacterium]